MENAPIKDILFIETENTEGSETLLQRISDLERYRCTRMSLEHALGLKDSGKHAFATTILNCDYLTSFELGYVNRLTELIESSPVLIMARHIAIDTFRKIDHFRNAVALQKNATPEIFSGLLNQMSSGPEIKPAICPRFVTDEQVRVMLLDSGISFNSRMRNYSAGGIFIEYRGFSLKVGDRVRVSLTASKTTLKTESLHHTAKVVWERKFDNNTLSPARGVGLQFT